MNPAIFATTIAQAMGELNLGNYDTILTPTELARFADYVQAERNMVPLSIGTVSVVDRFGGPGLGDMYYIVFRLMRDSEVHYFRMDGTYNERTDEVDWTDTVLREVEQVKRVVYSYE